MGEHGTETRNESTAGFAPRFEGAHFWGGQVTPEAPTTSRRRCGEVASCWQSCSPPTPARVRRDPNGG